MWLVESLSRQKPQSSKPLKYKIYASEREKYLETFKAWLGKLKDTD